MRTLANILWFILGGFFLGLTWWPAGVIMILLIITMPFARSAFMLGKFAFWPFGKVLIGRDALEGGPGGNTALRTIGNILWFVFAGVWIAIGHIATGTALCLTVIGIPFGWQHYKLAAAALFPLGKSFITKEQAAALDIG